MDIMEIVHNNRDIMKSSFLALHDIQTDQQRNIPQPPVQKPWTTDAHIIELPVPDNITLKKQNISRCIRERRSRRTFSDEKISLQELSYLLWSTQGISSLIKRSDQIYATLRTVPSAGARHPFETYILAHRIAGLGQGIYRYLALDHKLLHHSAPRNLGELITSATFAQRFSAECAAVFVWSCLPYRSEWRYDFSAHKVMLLDAGHVCQNLYLACEALGLGVCAIAAYDQIKMDNLLSLDGSDEFTVYLAPVGKIKDQS
ncbi:MAG: SagB/ThcOx family dehydrogenase [Candidatus Cloacimonetes bacterium]|nr:SagB/ThcOx family dehydrogenase [Candidatus Cloacimonadota bacterium]